MPPAGPFLLRALRYHIQQYTPPARSRGEPVCNTILLFLTCQAEQMPTHPGGHDARGHLALVILQQQWDDIFLFVSGFNTECAKSEERALNFSGRFASAWVFARRISSHFPVVGARTVSNACAPLRIRRAYLPNCGYWRLPTFRADTSRTLRKPSASAWS